MSLGKTLKALRQKKALNQKALSSLSGVSQATISRIETGRVRQLRSSALKNLADALGVSVDFMMGDPQVFADIPSSDSSSGAILGSSEFREERFRQIADLLDGLALHEDGRVLYVNEALAGMLGYKKEELLGKDGIELCAAPQSRALIQRMVNSNTEENYDALLVRKDGSVFPAEIRGRRVREGVRLTIASDTTTQRIRQAIMRIQRVGLEAEFTSELPKVVRILSDELEDMGQSLEAVSLHIIDETKDLITSHYALPELKGYRSFSEVAPLQKSLDQHMPLRGLVSHWHRKKVWEREGDEHFAHMMSNTPLGGSYRPDLIVDVPFEMGCLGVGLSNQSKVRRSVLIDMLQEFSHPISLVVNNLTQLQSLRDRLEKREDYANA